MKPQESRSVVALLASFTVAAAAVLFVSRSAAQAPPTPPPVAPVSAPAAAAPVQTQALDTSQPFDHDIHLSAPKMGGKQMGCQNCHEMVNSDGTCPKQEVRFPKHEACAGCHAANFYTPPLTICTNCHQTAKFVAANPLRELTRQVTPKKAEFSHRSHLAKNLDCTSCHGFVKGGDSVSHPSHPNCCECHAGNGMNGKVVQPTMNKCGECHSASKGAGRAPSKIHSFSHKTHNTDPRTSASMSCKQCHVNTAQANTLRQIQIPPMPVCVECHDGSDPNQPNPKNPAWRGTGAFHFSTCLKCHIAGSINSLPLPPSHPTTTAPGAL